MTSTPATEVFDWRSEYAYGLGIGAFVYGFPYVHNAQVRHDWVTQPQDPEHVPYAPVGQFWHARGLLDASFQGGGSPNNDTMYSIAWVDLSAEPVILSHPDVKIDRYFSFQLGAMTSDNFDYVGRRTTGSNAGDFLIAGPGWEGRVPDGVIATRPSPTPWFLCLGRTLVDGPDDVANVRALQAQYTLTPLSLWEAPDAKGPERRDVLVPIKRAADPLGPWKTLNAMLVENPPAAHHAVLLEQFAGVGIGPGLDVDAQPDAIKQSLTRAFDAGMQLLPGYVLSGDWAASLNGWRYPPESYGRAGDDFLLRAGGQSLGGIISNDPAEAVYLVSVSDASGTTFSSDSCYELSFSGTELPPVDAFWSLTMYKADMNLVPNAANRYALGDRTPGINRDADGGITFYIQRDRPGADKESNWLPCPDSGTWFIVLRMYQPDQAVVKATWKCPPVQKVA